MKYRDWIRVCEAFLLALRHHQLYLSLNNPVLFGGFSLIILFMLKEEFVSRYMMAF